MRRILSIDGGGIRGAFPAAFLAEVEQQVGSPIGQYFDLISGTSTGGIIALGLGMGMSAAEVLRFYEEDGPRIFAGGRKWLGLRWLARSKHGSKALRDALTKAFGARTLDESTIRLVIPSLNAETGDIYLYKTPHSARVQFDGSRLAVDVALATAAAPTYLPTHWPTIGPPLIDGGLWANNPAAVACVEALGVIGWVRDEIEMLSLGCTSSPLAPGCLRSIGLTGAVGWARHLHTMMMKGRSDGALGMAKNLLGKGRVHRVDPEFAPGRYSLDDPKSIRSLVGQGHHSARHALESIQHLFEQPADPFELVSTTR